MTDKEILKLINDALHETENELQETTKLMLLKDYKDYYIEIEGKQRKLTYDLVTFKIFTLMSQRDTLKKLKTAIKRINKGDKSLNDYSKTTFIKYKYDSAQD